MDPKEGRVRQMERGMGLKLYVLVSLEILFVSTPLMIFYGKMFLSNAAIYLLLHIHNEGHSCPIPVMFW